MQESWEELRGGKFSKVNNGGRERGKMLGRSLGLWGRRGPFIGPHEIDLLTTGNCQTEPEFPPSFLGGQNSAKDFGAEHTDANRKFLTGNFKRNRKFRFPPD